MPIRSILTTFERKESFADALKRLRASFDDILVLDNSIEPYAEVIIEKMKADKVQRL